MEAHTEAERIRDLESEVAALQRFKQFVHNYLDTHGVPHHPPGTHGAAGCRIGDRMDWLMAALAVAPALAAVEAARADFNDESFGEAAYCHHRHHQVDDDGNHTDHSSDFDTCPHSVCRNARSIAVAVEAARREEREACAKVAEANTQKKEWRNGVLQPDPVVEQKSA